MNRPLLIAHRGASGLAPENTQLALRRAAEAGADAAEIDVQLTADGVPVVLHDATVDRTTDGHGRIAALRWAEVARLRAREGERVPAFEAALAAAAEHDLLLAIEFKGRDRQPELIEQVIATVARADRASRVWYWSFDAADLRLVRELAPGAPTGGLSLGLPGRSLALVSDHLVPLAGHLALAWPGLVRRLPQPVVAWTTDRPALARRFAAAGMAGVISNHPERLRPVLDALV